MRIGISCLNYDPSYVGGVNTYVNGFLDGLHQLNEDYQIVLFCQKTNAHLFKEHLNDTRFSIVEIHLSSLLFRKQIAWQFVKFGNLRLYLWYIKCIERSAVEQIENQVDLIYFPTTLMYPYHFKIPSVVSIHDIQQVHFPHFFGKEELNARNVTYNATANRLDYLQASSNFMKKDFLDYFTKMTPKQVIIIPEGVDLNQFSPNNSNPSTLKAKYNIPDIFLFYPAQLWPHKDHITLLKAIHILKEKGIEVNLVLTGAKYSAHEAIMTFIKENNLETNVFYLGKVPFEDLLNLYKCAFCMVTTVLYESSSLPILEAAASGTAIIASNTAPNQELSRNLKINLFPPGNASLLAETIELLFQKKELLPIDSTYNLEAIKAYSWRNIALSYFNHFKQILTP